ncbi:MAG: FeoA family protein [Eubacteriales bacterium]|nr:FeoA family protein [Eubacteriales bacterium]
MPVSMGKIGETYTIKCVTGSGEVRSHLEAMGFTPGTEVRVISQLNGDVILGVKDSRVAVNEEQARHIMV